MQVPGLKQGDFFLFASLGLSHFCIEYKTYTSNSHGSHRIIGVKLKKTNCYTNPQRKFVYLHTAYTAVALLLPLSIRFIKKKYFLVPRNITIYNNYTPIILLRAYSHTLV